MVNLEERVVKELTQKGYTFGEKETYETLGVYKLKKRFSLVIVDTLLTKDNIKLILEAIEKYHGYANKGATYIVVGPTEESFEDKDLLYFNSINVVVTFVLLNKNNKEVKYYPKNVLGFGINPKKIVKDIVGVLEKY